ncbi:CocE/NonD family hydrolase [Mucilaginibacter myungsuensis]|uniref:CocE/NonD family hydrolase n=1 Tax=Mucilaginibacter myungsuensis TaxID=649104 RepID=A0A929PUW9_9SPHI|nr:CocE/NonD family hydrolase [Mucilaginibacter myungsuensis]MBE9660529.1 CocE/NonD family hydrolase [Mucilaginibacter myungsuensis]MDN3600574.1 CocE/NonD family hydrolase [Mucilaginibacter myungsuensis]
MKRILIYIFTLSTVAAFAQRGRPSPDAEYIKANYTKFEYQIPMRDGVKLFTSVYVPKDQTRKYPFMMDRTCYSVSPYGPDTYKTSLGPSTQFVHDGYIFVYQDVRGRYMSEGMYKEMTPALEVHKTNKDVDEGTDTYDTIDWLLKNVANNNGKVGVWGISYPGFYTTAALTSRHPALVAASPQAPIADLWRDDGWHNGAFFLVANFGFYPGFINRQDDKPTQRRGGRMNPGTDDGYDFFLKMGPMKNTNAKYYKDTMRLWNDLLAHPDYDQHWKDRNILTHLHDIKTAVLVTGGWYDAEDLYGAINTYKVLAKNNPKSPIYFTMGPWVHGGWAGGDGDALGDISFGGPTGPWYRENVEFRFFSHYLKGTILGDLATINTFETGTNKWRTYKAWPPVASVEKSLYLLPGGKLSFTAATSTKESFDAYESDPANPVPFTAAKSMGMDREYMVADQRFLKDRKDVISYTSDVLDKDVTIAGNIWPSLNVSTTGTDADFIVKVIDVYPDTAANNTIRGKEIDMKGYQQMVRSEPIRGKYRNAFDKPEPFVPGKITPVKFELQDVLHTFKKGHRIMVQIQSSMFPLMDRNPQTFVNIMKADESDFKKATHKVYTSKLHPSFLKVRVMN